MSSTVLMSWLAQQPGGIERAGIAPRIDAIATGDIPPGQLNVDELAKMLGAAAATKSGAVVTADTAMRVAAVYACVALISGALAGLPLPVYERTLKARKQADHDYWWFLNESANEEDASAVAMEYMFTAKLFYGDGIAKLVRPSPFSSRVIGYKPWHPDRWQPFREEGTRRRLHRFTDELGRQEILTDDDIIHFPSMGFNGLRSPSPITYAAREAIGNALAAEEFSARFFTNGSTHDIALRHQKNLSKQQIEDLRTSYAMKYGGGANNRSPLILTGGLEVEKLSITPADAALLPTRQFTVEEICRIFGVPPFMIGANDKTTSWGTGIEALGTGFTKFALRRHIVPAQQELNRKLWPRRERFFVEFDLSELTRADFKTRMEGYRIAIGRAGEPGWVKPNEVRFLEKMEPIEGEGDKLNTGATAPSGNSAEPNGSQNSDPKEPTQ